MAECEHAARSFRTARIDLVTKGQKNSTLNKPRLPAPTGLEEFDSTALEKEVPSQCLFCRYGKWKCEPVSRFIPAISGGAGCAVSKIYLGGILWLGMYEARGDLAYGLSLHLKITNICPCRVQPAQLAHLFTSPGAAPQRKADWAVKFDEVKRYGKSFIPLSDSKRFSQQPMLLTFSWPDDSLIRVPAILATLCLFVGRRGWWVPFDTPHLSLRHMLMASLNWGSGIIISCQKGTDECSMTRNSKTSDQVVWSWRSGAQAGAMSETFFSKLCFYIILDFSSFFPPRHFNFFLVISALFSNCTSKLS